MSYGKVMNMFKNRSKALFASALVATIYLVYIISYFTSINSEATNDTEAIGSALATALVMPHMFLLGLGVLFNWLGFFLRGTGFSLTAAILYCVAAVLFIPYAPMVLPAIVLGFVGYSKQKGINRSLKA